MAGLVAPVALAAARVPARREGARFGAISGDVAGTVAFVARLGFGFLRAVLGDMAFSSAVVAGRSSSFRAVGGLVAESTAVEASTSARHFYLLVKGLKCRFLVLSDESSKS